MPRCFKCEHYFVQDEEYSVQEIITTDGKTVEIGWHQKRCPVQEVDKTETNKKAEPLWSENLRELCAKHRAERIARGTRLNEINQQLTEINREIAETRQTLNSYLDAIGQPRRN